MFKFNQQNQLLSESSTGRITEIAPSNPTYKISANAIKFNLKNVGDFLSNRNNKKQLDPIVTKEIAQIGKKATITTPKVFVSEVQTAPTNIAPNGFVRRTVAQIKADGDFQSVDRSVKISNSQKNLNSLKSVPISKPIHKTLEIVLDPITKKMNIQNSISQDQQILTDYQNFHKTIKENNALRAQYVAKR
jgi:hypothetical protein